MMPCGFMTVAGVDVRGGRRRAVRRAADERSESLFVFGLGYCSLALSAVLVRQGWNVVGTCRSESRAEEISERLAGVCAHPWEAGEELEPDAMRGLLGSSHVLSTVPPVDGRDPVLTPCTEEALRCSGHLQWTVRETPTRAGSGSKLSGRWLARSLLGGKWRVRQGYLSSTSVYTESDGGWVDENSPTDADNPRVAAEDAWLSLPRDGRPRSNVFRLAGIYGPGRNALETLRSGRSGDLSDPKLVSRIHVGDICRAIHASMVDRAGQGIYNLADDLPAARYDVFTYARSLLPGGGSAATTENRPRTSRDRRRSSKKVGNGRMRQHLVPELAYPTYREGLVAIHSGETWPFSAGE